MEERVGVGLGIEVSAVCRPAVHLGGTSSTQKRQIKLGDLRSCIKEINSNK